MMNRIAASLYWIGRYTERAENHARLIDAFYHIREETSTGERLWIRIVQALGDPAVFESMYRSYGEREVLHYMILDPAHINSIHSCVNQARSNLKMIRDRLPDELWDILNGFALWLKSNETDELLLDSPFLFLKRVKEWLGTFYGVAHHTMMRDHHWHILECGRFLERAENAARLFDSVYHSILEEPKRTHFFLFSAVRAIGGADVFRRLHTDHFTIENVVSLLLLNERFPRSVQFGLSMLEEHLRCLRNIDSSDTTYERTIRLVVKARSEMSWLEADPSDGSLHEHLLRGMSVINGLGSAVGNSFFRTEQGANA
ncbi:alpha-E domain-containing protein [Paenibacillus sp.]|uniref:alpha-E domain-containing protein n=1 Tax=Paenibacillus sp. TaxID=58172 RepID=UPI002D40CFBC|nr:alpha-E domain-containing protein [Paenibacillus sp.]HZG87688.1 alpha-E domain-containing protein [Paenibacillus sp.]